MRLKGIGRFIGLTMVALLPLWILTGLYVALDPYDMLRPSTPPYPRESRLPYSIGIANMHALRTLPDSIRPNSFIFGSSHMQNFPAEIWQDQLQPFDRPFHLEGAAENLDAIWRKIKWLDINGYAIDNAVIELWVGSFSPRKEGVSYELPSEVQSLTEVLAKHYRALRFFIDKDVLIGTLKYIKNGDTTSLPFHLMPEVKYYDPWTNQVVPYSGISDPEPHWLGPVVIEPSEPFDEKAAAQMVEILQIFDKHNTDYQVFVSPSLQPSRMSHKDIEALRNVIPADCFHDFSAAAEEGGFASDTTQWIDRGHYSSRIAAEMIRQIYRE